MFCPFLSSSEKTCECSYNCALFLSIPDDQDPDIRYEVCSIRYLADQAYTRENDHRQK